MNPITSAAAGAIGTFLIAGLILAIVAIAHAILTSSETEL